MTTNVTRRGFLGSIGVAAAAVAVPAVAGAAAPSTWAQYRARLPELRAAYLAELERFGESLRPDFASGKLRAITDEDVDDGVDQEDTCPSRRLERLVAAHFGLEVKEIGTDEGTTYEGDEAAAHLVLLGSPSAEAVDDNANHVAFWATTAATWDVILLARARGWYVPGPTEQLGRNFDEDRRLTAERGRSMAPRAPGAAAD